MLTVRFAVWSRGARCTSPRRAPGRRFDGLALPRQNLQLAWRAMLSDSPNASARTFPLRILRASSGHSRTLNSLLGLLCESCPTEGLASVANDQIRPQPWQVTDGIRCQQATFHPALLCFGGGPVDPVTFFPGPRENFPALADLISCSARPGIRFRTGSAPRVFARSERLIAPKIDQIPCIFPWNRELARERSSLWTAPSAT